MSVHDLDKRRLERKPVGDHTIDVFSLNDAAVIGRIANIHSEGFMLIGDSRVQPNHVYQLNILLSEPINGQEKIHLGAECLWTKETGSGDQQWAGFHIIDLAEDAADLIDVLVSQLAE